MSVDRERLEFDYSETLTTWRMLVGVRFKLLALVPTATGLGIGALGTQAGYVSSVVAAGALAALFGIVMYDLRNSTFHDAAIHRATQLETSMKLPKMSNKGTGRGGLLNERPRDRYRFFGVLAWQDRALFIIYSASAAGWVMVLILGVLAEWDLSEGWRFGVSGIGAIAVFVLSIYQLQAFDQRVDKPTPPDQEELSSST